MGVYYGLQIYNSVVNMVAKGLVLEQSLMVISTLLLYKKYVPFIMNCFCLHIK